MRGLWLVVVVAAGCLAPQPEARGIPWEPLECDPGQVDWLAGGVEVLPFWNQTPEEIAAGYAAAAGHRLAAHRSSGPSVHEWELDDADGTYLGQLELRRLTLPHSDGTEWRLRSEAGMPANDTVRWARQLVETLAGPVSMREQVLDEAGIVHVELFQSLGAFRIVDTASLDAGLSGYRLHNNASTLSLRPWYDLAQAAPELQAQDAIDIATEFFACTRDVEVHVVGSELAVLHGTLAYAVDLRDADPHSWLCVPPILVDAASGAVLGTASTDVCALPE